MGIKSLTEHIAKAITALEIRNDNAIQNNDKQGTLVVIYPFVTKLTGKAEKFYQAIKGAKNLQNKLELREKNEEKAKTYLDSLNILHNKLW